MSYKKKLALIYDRITIRNDEIISAQIINTTVKKPL